VKRKKEKLLAIKNGKKESSKFYDFIQLKGFKIKNQLISVFKYKTVRSFSSSSNNLIYSHIIK